MKIRWFLSYGCFTSPRYDRHAAIVRLLCGSAYEEFSGELPVRECVTQTVMLSSSDLGNCILSTNKTKIWQAMQPFAGFFSHCP